MKIKTVIEAEDGTEREVQLPARWEICERCRGNGKHDHPAFANGLSREDFDEDPDFEEAYFRGDYDVQCTVCDGSGKVLVPDEDAIRTPAQRADLQAYHEKLRRDAAYEREDAAIRRMESGGY